MAFFSWLFGQNNDQAPQTHGSSKATPRQRVPSSEFGKSSKKVLWRSGSFPLEIVGESNYQQELISICGPYTEDGHDQSHQAIMVLEPTNPYDKNAVKILLGNKTVGYLAREQAVRVGNQMRESGISSARCDAIVRGGWTRDEFDEGMFGVRLAVPSRGKIDFD